MNVRAVRSAASVIRWMRTHYNRQDVVSESKTEIYFNNVAKLDEILQLQFTIYNLQFTIAWHLLYGNGVGSLMQIDQKGFPFD